MTDEELQRLYSDTAERLMARCGITRDAAEFTIKMIASFHTTLGGALYRINDYLDDEQW